ncbi:MAG: DUF3299 domain-containing protein [Pseudomonadota bacterium]
MTNRILTAWPAFAMLLVIGATARADDARELTWDDLIPEDAELVQQAPNTGDNLDGYYDVEPGQGPDPFEDLMSSPVFPAGVVEELDGTTVKIPGFVVPLGFAEEGKIKDFLLVPYFGACIHYPPPPANQMVYVTTEKPIAIESTWAPIWAIGELKTQFHRSELGSAEYTMKMDSIKEYEY